MYQCGNKVAARQKNVQHLPVRSFTVPQRDGSIKSIEALNYKVTKKSLGIQFTGDGKTTNKHTKWMEEKKTWTDNLRNKGFITSQDGWKSLNTQLKLKLEFGLVAVCVPPKKLEELLGRI